MISATRLIKICVVACVALPCFGPTVGLANTKSHPHTARHAQPADDHHRVKSPGTRSRRKASHKVTHKHARIVHRHAVLKARKAQHHGSPKKVAKSRAASRSPGATRPTPPLTPLTPLFSVPSTANMQGVAYHNGVFYVGFDLGNGQGDIQEYSLSGQLLRDSGPLAIGHTASISYCNADGTLLVANGGGQTPTMVYEVNVDAQTPAIVRSLDFTAYGMAGLAAVDNDNNTLWLHTASSDTGTVTFRHCDLNGQVLTQFTLPNQGVPQGLAVYHGNLYYYTDNKVTVLSQTGQILKTVYLYQSGESEGLTIVDGANPGIAVGYSHPNRYYLVPGLLS